ncbi:MAG: AtpZ/AtpI family protein [Actinomycetes bacterium]
MKEPSLTGLLGLGLVIACSMTAGMAVGWFVDRWLGTAPVFVLLGLASGIVLGIFGTIIEVRRHLDG